GGSLLRPADEIGDVACGLFHFTSIQMAAPGETCPGIKDALQLPRMLRQHRPAEGSLPAPGNRARNTETATSCGRNLPFGETACRPEMLLDNPPHLAPRAQMGHNRPGS